MNLVLPPYIEKLIEDRVRSGRYESPADVVAAAVAQLDLQEQASDAETLGESADGLLAAGLDDHR